MNERIAALKQIAEEIATISTEEEQISLLSRGFELFSLETEQLSKAYSHLHNQFRKVNEKLEETNDRLSNKVHELHVLTNYLDNILNRMSQGLVFIDSKGKISTYNKAAEALLELPEQTVLYRNFFKTFKNDQFGYPMGKALEEKSAPSITHISLVFEDGRQKQIEVSSTFVPGTQESDLSEGIIVLLRNITEMKRLQILASRNDRMQALGEMAAQVAHEIRNPLGGIKGFAALLHRDLAEKPEMQRLTNYILEGTNTLERLVTQVLNFSRPLSLELENTDLFILLNELKETLLVEHVLQENIQFQLKADPGIFATIDPGLLKAAIHNLLINAIQAMPEGGKLEMKLYSDGNKAHIAISDTGIGIPQENLKMLFSPFFSTKPNGNGLGLAESHKALQAHGGEIIVDSCPGFGTCFTLKIPLQI